MGVTASPVIDMAAVRTQSLRALPRNGLELPKAQKLQMMKAMEGEKIRCEHYLAKIMKGAAVAGPLLKGCEALALVDERLAGEGTGKFLGINDPALGAAIGITFFIIWALWFGSQKLLGDDSGLDIP